MRVTFLSLSCVCILLAATDVGRAADDVEFFEKKIRPVLVEHCYRCHGEKRDRGGLRVDTKEALLKGGDTGPALVVGQPDKSLLVHALRYTDSDLRMPPKGKLPAAVIADFEKWVKDGAADPRVSTKEKVVRKDPTLEEGREFWSFKPVKKPALPKVEDKTWAHNAIDQFILAKLEENNLKPGPDADRLTLVRRAYFDLVGLPPTPQDIDAFLADKSKQAYEKLIDRLLASPEFGVRWGRHWLDVARYADSSGGGRSLLFKDAWRYRDYVIDAFNTDKSFRRFILEQIAGDLLKAKTPEERRQLLIATAFLILGPHNYERQDKPVLEMDIIDEQLDTVGKAFLGMTIGCARCHDHKFDPIPTRDYYALAGIFKSSKFIVHNNVSKWAEATLPMSAEEQRRQDEHKAQVAALKEQIRIARAEEVKLGIAPEGALLVKGAIDPTTLPGIVIDDEQAKRVGPWSHSTFTGNFIGKGYYYDNRGQNTEKTLTFQPEFTKSGFYEVLLAYVPYSNRATNVPVRVFSTDGDETFKVNQKKTPPIEGRFVSLGKFRFEKGNQWFVMVSTEGANGHVVADAVQFLPVQKDDDDDKPVAKETKSPKLAKNRVSSKELEARLKKLLGRAPTPPRAMAVSEAKTIEDCHINIRGNFHNKGAQVPRGFLQIITPDGAMKPGAAYHIDKDESGRLQLAHWLANPDNPLTTRVTVNRIWHHLFGVGIVRTVDNFGKTGELPSHPELLDFLATRFVENDWSMKKMIREIMLSRTYQLASLPHPEARRVDPENRLLARQNRRRLEAEAIRDSVLLVSGNLDRKLDGPSMASSTSSESDHKFDDTRRSVYTPVLRNTLLEIFEVFDFADPNVCNGRRNVSTVSTQALYLMNSPFILDEAKLAAKRLLKNKDLTEDADRIDWAYRSALGRLPSERERTIALNFLSATPSEDRNQAWERIYQMLYGCIDFRYVN